MLEPVRGALGDGVVVVVCTRSVVSFTVNGEVFGLNAAIEFFEILDVSDG
jgi:hypothetical protein